MNKPAIHVVVDEPDMYDYKALLAELAPEVTLTLCEDPAAPPAAIADAEILLTWRPHPHVLQGMPKLKWIHSTGAGVEAILQSDYFSPTVTLTRTGKMAGRLMAEYVLGFILATTFRLPFVAANQQHHRWQPFKIHPVQGKSCTILGMGEIGQEIAALCQAIALNVTGINRTGSSTIESIPTYSIEFLDQVLPVTDILVVVVPLTPETEGMLDARRLNLLPDQALIINVSRGPVIVEADLIQVLKERSLTAVLDVFNQEPLPPDSPFWDMDNVIVTPHIAGPYDPEFCTQVFLDNLERYRLGQKMNYVVDYAKGY
ncbi:MAG: D-2-hydroxyacid dehydrogenase [Oculatellaceae cyanobacterium bins.114]|nr:D-2-hydroxyacid dehydrogenase [Oculatellaceae cyanobacterium bins.114]